MRIFNWSSFDNQFPEMPVFFYSGFEELGFEFVFQTGDLRRIMIRKGEGKYLLENLGGGYFSVNDSFIIFTGKQLYEYLFQMGKGDVSGSIKTQIRAMKNRFNILKEIMERV